ncbi:MAG TPA: hypothetical protein VLA56_18655 [Pseudomonadales bacterium]|nr:hypothetical protein [Pseudomonadales bacterium]
MRRPSGPGASRSAAVAGLLFALLACTLALPARATDMAQTARLMVTSGLLADAERPHRLFVEELTRLDVPEDVDPLISLSIRSTFPAAQIRQRWLRELALRLDDEALAEAREFFGSIPGQTFGAAMRQSRRTLANARMSPIEPSPTIAAAVALLDADAREQILQGYSRGFALWVARLIAGETDADGLEAAFDDALKGLPPTRRHVEALALASLPDLYLLGLMEYAESAPGQRFFAACTQALDEAMRQMMYAQLGHFMESVVRRTGPAESLETP